MSLLRKLATQVRGWLQATDTPAARNLTRRQGASPADTASLGESLPADGALTTAIPYDEALHDRARTQWQFGDWERLAAISPAEIQHHPDRAKLALLAASGLLQLGRTEEGQSLVRQALDWGCSPRLVRQILISGTHNSLACARAILGHEQHAAKHFEMAIHIEIPNADRLIKMGRSAFQIKQVGIETKFQIGWGFADLSPNNFKNELVLTSTCQAETLPAPGLD